MPSTREYDQPQSPARMVLECSHLPATLRESAAVRRMLIIGFTRQAHRVNINFRFRPIAAVLLFLALQGCATTNTVRDDGHRTYELMDTAAAQPLMVRVVDVRPEGERQELRIDPQRLRLGDQRFTTSPEQAVAMHMSRLSLDMAIPAERRQQLQTSGVQLKEFNVRITATEALEEREPSGFPGMAAVDYLVRSAVNASIQAGWVDVQLELEIGGKQFLARRGKKFVLDPSSGDLQWALDAAMLEIRRQLIARPLAPAGD